MTYAGYLSYVYARVGQDDARVKAALKWISENYTLEENPGVNTQGLYYYYHTFATAMAARGEATMKDKDGKAHDWAKELAAKLVSLQAEDGSWLNKTDRWHEGDKIICTAYSVRALAKALENMKPAAADKPVDESKRALDRVL
jgi:squalene-hopene/tetraprenyl-beta-curcumene cyclase